MAHTGNGSLRVLLATDNGEGAKALSSQLEREGCVVIAVRTGAEALDGGGGPYDLIFLDLDLPDTDGLTVLKQLRSDERSAETPVVFAALNGLPVRIIATMNRHEPFDLVAIKDIKTNRNIKGRRIGYSWDLRPTTRRGGRCHALRWLARTPARIQPAATSGRAQRLFRSISIWARTVLGNGSRAVTSGSAPPRPGACIRGARWATPARVRPTCSTSAAEVEPRLLSAGQP